MGNVFSGISVVILVIVCISFYTFAFLAGLGLGQKLERTSKRCHRRRDQPAAGEDEEDDHGRSRSTTGSSSTGCRNRRRRRLQALLIRHDPTPSSSRHHHHDGGGEIKTGGDAGRGMGRMRRAAIRHDPVHHPSPAQQHRVVPLQWRHPLLVLRLPHPTAATWRT